MPAGWSRRTRQHGLLIVPPLAAILLGLFYVGLANAWAANGCKFPGTNPEIAYWFYSPDPAADWDEAVNYAQINWDSSTPGYGGYFVNSSSDIEIKTYDSTYSQEWTGLTTGGCASGGGQPWSNDLVRVYFNLNQDSGLDTNEKIAVAAHEYGHALGLAHSFFTVCSTNVVMHPDATYHYNNCGAVNPPWPNDEAGVSSIYSSP